MTAVWGRRDEGWVLIVPPEVAVLTGAREGEPFEFEPATSEIPDLETLCARITPENGHGEIDWGPPRGREVW